tara:strand:+ start:336 stop:506 length:171 start_codon:yes stop_codon:yes gene_type:complete
MVKMFLSIFGQTPKHVFLSDFGSATTTPSPGVFFNVFGIGVSKTRVFKKVFYQQFS